MVEINISQIASKMGGDVDEFARAFKIALFNGVVRDTRVDTGRLRGNWQTTVGEPAEGQLDRLDPSGRVVTEEILQTVQADTVDWITNNIEYAKIWNERDGMVDRNVARINRIAKEVAK
tara:strand:- start:1078 stop:1434 length:357 start_codon:yes stop_codon:yes gene_type:complete